MLLSRCLTDGSPSRVVEAASSLRSAISTGRWRLCTSRLSIRNAVVTGRGGKQILLDDPAGNPIELFETTAHRTPTRSDLMGVSRADEDPELDFRS